MEIVPIKDVLFYSRLGQNIYRHDGLLALPRGTILKKNEIEELKYHGIDYVIVFDGRTNTGEENDVNFTLNVIESAFTKTTLWNENFGKEIFDYIRKHVIKNKKISKLLNELRIVDSYSFAQCINISIIVVSLLKKQINNVEFLSKMAFISLLHDIGRLKMIDIITKKGNLTDNEFEKLKMHPEESYKLLKKAGFADEDILFVTETHEKFNGTGYPYRLKGNQISDLGQLILIADVYNALSSFRPYRDVYNPHKVSKMIEEEKGKAFNEDIVKLFRDNFEPYKKGIQVELNDGSLARVKTTQYSKTLPVVEVIDEDTNDILKTIDLSLTDKIRIKKIVSI